MPYLDPFLDIYGFSLDQYNNYPINLTKMLSCSLCLVLIYQLYFLEEPHFVT